MIHEQEITLLYDHMDRNYILPPYVIDREKFDKISYGRWAIEEIIGLLADFPGRGADRIIRESKGKRLSKSRLNTLIAADFEVNVTKQYAKPTKRIGF